MIPDEAGALALHRKYGSSERVVQHCRTVARASVILTDAFRERAKKIDAKAVLAGALLHDVGRSRTQDVGHGWVGAKMLEKEGVEDIVVEIVRRHVGAGIPPDEAKALGFPDGDYVPRTVEQMVVCFADKLVSGDSVRPLEEEVRRYERKGHDVQRLLDLRKRLEEGLGEDPERLVLEKFIESGR